MSYARISNTKGLGDEVEVAVWEDWKMLLLSSGLQREEVGGRKRSVMADAKPDYRESSRGSWLPYFVVEYLLDCVFAREGDECVELQLLWTRQGTEDESYVAMRMHWSW